MHNQGIIRIVIHLHTSWPQTWLMLPSPFLPPCPAIVLRVRKIDVGGKTFGGVSEGREDWSFGIAGERSVKVGVKGKALTGR